MGTTMVRVSQEIAESARQHAALYRRSAGEQLEHWARLGRAVEASPDFSTLQIAKMLTASIDQASVIEHPHMPVIRLEVAIERIGAEIARINSVYDPDIDSEEHRQMFARLVELSDLQDSLGPDDTDKIAEILAGRF